jgi:glucans biosynthesis protein C
MANQTSNPALHYKPGRILWIDYLRSFITVLVIAHHSSLAYTTFASANSKAYILSSHPIVDRQRWIGLDIFENFNDVFFMALMFLIGGIFIVKTIQKKGVARFIRDRFYRLFIPFIIAVSFLMPLAYYPAYHLVHPDGGISSFLFDFFSVEGWPPGPPWFIWVLFLFNTVFALCSRRCVPLITKAGNRLNNYGDKPYRIVLLFFIISYLLYVPASLIFGAYTWASFGPLAFQKSRLLLYFSFFVAGSIIGVSDFNSGLFSAGSGFVKRWRIWLGCCLFFYLLLIVLESLGRLRIVGALGIWPARIIYGAVYTLSTCFSSIALLTFFRHRITRSSRFMDSLCENAYCIYLVHYIFVIWCQYILLRADLTAPVKFGVTFIFSTAFSWMLSILLRKISIVKTYV